MWRGTRLSCVKWCDLWVTRLLPSSLLPIVGNPAGATEECFTWHQLKSVSGETVVRETVMEGGRPGESQSHRWIDTELYMLIIMLCSGCKSPCKAGRGKAVRAGSARSFPNLTVIAEKNQQNVWHLIWTYRCSNSETDNDKRNVTPLMWCSLF